ncbi:adenylate/guanylate cyclase domain-containing protein, partial [Candidatus Fermentibacterales bacterium]|nr:adenylate/guanylate cyclase domain-containing protein [Candidatus Fermentibacterales bacterium]
MPGHQIVFLFTDIEGSTRKWQEHQDSMPEALSEHDRIVLSCISEFGGRRVKHTGDGVMAVFDD